MQPKYSHENNDESIFMAIFALFKHNKNINLTPNQQNSILICVIHSKRLIISEMIGYW